MAPSDTATAASVARLKGTPRAGLVRRPERVTEPSACSSNAFGMGER